MRLAAVSGVKSHPVTNNHEFFSFLHDIGGNKT
jgi:hypothetical protein